MTQTPNLSASLRIFAMYAIGSLNSSSFGWKTAEVQTVCLFLEAFFPVTAEAPFKGFLISETTLPTGASGKQLFLTFNAGDFEDVGVEIR